MPKQPLSISTLIFCAYCSDVFPIKLARVRFSDANKAGLIINFLATSSFEDNVRTSDAKALALVATGRKRPSKAKSPPGPFLAQGGLLWLSFKAYRLKSASSFASRKRKIAGVIQCTPESLQPFLREL